MLCIHYLHLQVPIRSASSSARAARTTASRPSLLVYMYTLHPTALRLKARTKGSRPNPNASLSARPCMTTGLIYSPLPLQAALGDEHLQT